MAMTISPFALVGGVGMIAVALGFAGYAVANRLGMKYLGLGALAWVITVAVKFTIAVPTNGWMQNRTRAFGEPWGSLVMALYGGLLTGVTEVGLTWCFLRYTRFGRAAWPRVVAFGIGFGAIEALLLGVGSLVAAIVAMKMPERLPREVLEQLAHADNLWIQLAPICERFFACLGHVGTNVMIFYAVVRQSPRWFWLAFVFKTAIDAIATAYVVSGVTKTLAQIWGMEAIAAAWGIVGLLLTIWIGRRYSQVEVAQLPIDNGIVPS